MTPRHHTGHRHSTEPQNRFSPVFSVSLWLLCVSVVSAGCDELMRPSHLKLSGTLELTEHAVGARVPGRLTTLLVDDGDVVRQGQLLGTLDRFEQAKRDYDRITQLFEQGGATQQQVEQAGLALEDQRVVSPVDGVILLKVHESGEVVAAGGPIVKIGDRQKVWVKVYVPEGAINRVSLGQAATVRLDGLKQSLKGHVTFIAPKAEFTPRNVQTSEERVTQTFAVKVTLDALEPFVRPGVAADVTLDLNGTIR